MGRGQLLVGRGGEIHFGGEVVAGRRESCECLLVGVEVADDVADARRGAVAALVEDRRADDLPVVRVDSVGIRQKRP